MSMFLFLEMFHLNYFFSFSPKELVWNGIYWRWNLFTLYSISLIKVKLLRIIRKWFKIANWTSSPPMKIYVSLEAKNFDLIFYRAKKEDWWWQITQKKVLFSDEGPGKIEKLSMDNDIHICTFPFNLGKYTYLFEPFLNEDIRICQQLAWKWW